MYKSLYISDLYCLKGNLAAMLTIWLQYFSTGNNFVEDFGLLYAE